MKKASPLFSALMILVLLAQSACQAGTPAASASPWGTSPTSTATPTLLPTATATPVSDQLARYLSQPQEAAPRVTLASPAAGQALAPSGELSLAFDQPMDPDSTARALTVSDAAQAPVDGAITWKTTRLLVFHPSRPLQAGSSYQVRLGAAATSASGKALDAPLALSFQTAGELKVSQVFPADGAKDIENSAAITVMFNRPVVPLVIAEEQARLPAPLQLDPPAAGHGEWVNTSLYVFHPDKVLVGGQTYRATIRAGLADASGEKSAALPQDYSWSFTVVAPSVAAISLNDMNLADGLVNAPLAPVIKLTFRQPMDHQSVESNLQLAASGASLPTTYKWDEKSLQVELKPVELLALSTVYRLTLKSSARSADGSRLGQGLVRSFTTVPYPAVRSTVPADGATNAQPNFEIQFASPMEFKSLADRVVFIPAFDTKGHSFYNPGRSTLSFYGLLPSTRYTVRILPGMRDPYGNAIQSEKAVTFTTRPLSPGASLLMPYLSMLRAGGPQDFYLQYTNLTSLSVRLYRLSYDQAAQILNPKVNTSPYTGLEQDLIWQYAEKPAAKQDEKVVKDLTLSNGGQPLPGGFYFLGLNASPVQYKAPFLDSRLIFVSSDNVTVKVSPGQLLAWVTDLQTGRPVAGLRAKVYNTGFAAVAEGVTDADGLLQVAVNTSSGSQNNLFTKTSVQGVWYVVVDEPGQFAFGSSGWGSGAAPGAFGPYDLYYRPWADASAYVYTERPLYRPGQPVYFKGIVRADDDLAYSLPAQKEVEVVINNYKEQVFQTTLPLSEIGTFDGQFQLAAETALGSYSLRVRWPGSQAALISINFDVAEYRKPEFQLDLKSDPANLLPGDSFKVDLAASYYSGGGLSGADVGWTLRSEPYTFSPPPAYSGYSFSNIAYDNWNYYNSNQQESSRSGLIAQGQGKTDADGKIAFTLKAEPSASKASQSLVFEATVTDFSGSSVSGQARVVMHKSAVYPGVRSKTYVGTVDQPQTIQLVALDWSGKPLGGAKVDVQIVERKWYSVQQEDDSGQLTWQSTVQEIPAASFTGVALDDKGLGSVSFRPARGGIYRAIVTAVDARGNPAQASAFLWVTGKEYIPWVQTNDRSFQLVADRDSYTPGDTAELLIASPFQGECYALVTVERGHVRKSEVLRLEGNSTLYKLPVTPDMAPNVYVSVVVVKGVDATNLRPSFKVGVARLKVATDQQALTVTLKADRSEAAPREQVQYTVQTASLDGKPVQAEVSLALSDLATLSLKSSDIPSLMDFFYAPRSLSVITGVAMVNSIEEYNATIADVLAPQGQKMGSGGGKGGGEAGVIDVRQDFPDTAFWQARVQTGPDGRAAVTVTLPDNLTTWRLDARAVTADTRVGQATLDLISTKPLLVRPQTPRFLVVGDLVTLGAAVHNNTAAAMSVTVSLQAGGVTLASPAGQTVEIPARSQAYVTWQASVPQDSQRVDLVFSAAGGGLSDASKPTLGTLDGQGLPVYRYETPETVGTSGVLTENGARAEMINLPADMNVQQGQLKIEIAPALAAGMTDGLTYLEHYPYECTEQTISRFLPNLRLAQALKAAGIQDAALQAGLQTQVNLALQKLYNRQNPDGGWGWWGGMKSDVLTTAYAALGLYEAGAAGYPANPQSLQKALAFLRANLQSFQDQTPPEQLNRQAFVLYVLARAGAPEISKTVQLYDQRQGMGLYARAYLLQALHKINPADERLKTLISDLASAAILSAAGAHWEEGASDYWNWNTDLRTTAIVLAALIETDPGNALNANAVRWLMVNRKAGRWSSTQETAWTLLALTDWVNATGELNPNYNYALAFNGKQLLQGSASPAAIREVKSLVVDVTQMLSSEGNRLVFAREGSTGSLYYTAYLNVWLPVNQVKALDRGVVVSRQYFRPGDLAHPVTEASQGEVLLARLTVVAPNTLRYLLVDDPLPAGMEAVDPSLNTSPQAEQPDSYDWKRIGVDGWGWWFFSHIELRDERVVLSTDWLPGGTYVYTYLVRASTPGTFNVMPPTAQEFYFPDVYGRGSGSQFVINP